MLMVPLFAIGVWTIYPRARRYYGEHLVFSFYATGFYRFILFFTTFYTT